MEDGDIKKRRIILIGHGGISQSYLKAFSSLDHVAIVCVVGRNVEKANAFATKHGIPFCGTSVEAVARQSNATAAVSARPMPLITKVLSRLPKWDCIAFVRNPFILLLINSYWHQRPVKDLIKKALKSPGWKGQYPQGDFSRERNLRFFSSFKPDLSNPFAFPPFK